MSGGPTRYCAVCLTTFPTDGAVCANLACGAPRPAGGWGLLLGPGDLLDRHYRIERPLAVGGAGLTYLAREVDGAGVARPPDLAIKVLYASRASGSFLRRLSTEAQILQELDHPNIVQLRGFVHRAGQEPYLVTLFEHGGNLAQHLERSGPLPPRIAAGVLQQVLAALDVAHQRGVVHRDLKPDNVLLRERAPPGAVPQVRVADFGIAKVAGGMGRLTRHGGFVGTPEYAAPEQFTGMDPTPAADVFAAGALFLHLLTGALPISFGTRTDIESCHAEWLRQLPPRIEPARAPGADPVELAVATEVLRGMMDVAPERRWTVQRVLARLDGLASGGAELQPRETLDVTGRPAPARAAAPEIDVTEPIADLPRSEAAKTEDLSSPSLVAMSLAPSAPPPPPRPAPPALAPEPEPDGVGRGGCVAAIAGLGALGAAGLALVGVLAVLGAGGLAWWSTAASDPTPAPRPPAPAPGPPPSPGPAPAPGPAPSPGPAPAPAPGPPNAPVPSPAPSSGVAATAFAVGSPEGRAIQAALSARALDCGAPTPLLGTAWTDGREVVRIELDPGQVDADRAACVARALTGVGVPTPAGRARFAVR